MMPGQTKYTEYEKYILGLIHQAFAEWRKRQ